MKICTIIPTYNHRIRLGEIINALPNGVCAIVVDDGSNPPIEIDSMRAKLFRFEKNRGKAEALKFAFSKALEMGFTHAITLDADGQHKPSLVQDFIECAEKNPDALILGVRDFNNPSIPPARRFMNKFSNFWFWAETGKNAGDTQCGFRCYPLAQILSLNMDFGGFVFETELLVKASWAEIEFKEIKIPTIYDSESVAGSHYRPIADTFKFTMMNTKLFFASIFLSKNRLKNMSLKK